MAAGNQTPVVLAVIAAAVVLVAAVAVPTVAVGLREGRTATMGPAIEADGSVGTESNLDSVKTYKDLPTTHVDEDVDYDQTPPAGGKHDPTWLACGAYDEPVRDENAVHALEHGTVWITYQSDLSGDDVDTLKEKLPEEGILSPYDDLPAPVVITVWERQLQLDGADDPRLDLFIQEYGDGSTSPEPFASCEGGITGGDDSGEDV